MGRNDKEPIKKYFLALEFQLPKGPRELLKIKVTPILGRRFD